MAGLQYQQLPKLDEAQGTMKTRLSDMGSLLDKQYRAESYGVEQEYLTDNQFQNKMSALNSRYQNQWSQMQAQQQAQNKEMENMRDMVARGQMDPQQAQMAAQRMVMSPEVFAAAYPKPGPMGAAPPKPMSSAAVRSSTTLMQEFASGAVDKRGLEWGDPRKKAGSLVNQYVDWRAQIGYDELPATHQRQLDQRWDALMRSDVVYKHWFADKEKKKVIAEAKSLRTKTKIGQAMQLKVAGPAAVRYSTSPLGRSVIKTNTKPVQRPSTDQNVPTAEQLTSQWEKAMSSGASKEKREAIFEQGKTLGYWE